MNKKMIKNRIATNKVTESQITKKEQESSGNHIIFAGLSLTSDAKMIQWVC